MKQLMILRSYGDFAICINALSLSSQNESIQLFASKHLFPFFEALPAGLIPENVKIEFIDLGISRNILGVFTNKFLFNSSSVKELLNLRAFVKERIAPSSDLFLEQSRRLRLIERACGRTLRPVHTSGNIYDSYRHFFGGAGERTIAATAAPKHLNILVLPDSRLESKAFSEGLIHELSSLQLHSGSVRVAFLNNAGKRTGDHILVYRNFKELAAMVQAADLIITADSLPAHLAQLFGKPHWIFYRDRINHEWLTPFSKDKHSYGLFNETNKLEKFIKGYFENLPY